MRRLTTSSDHLKPHEFGTKAIKIKILEKRITGIPAMKPSRIARR